MNEETGSDSVRSVDRALDILLAFEPNDPPLGAGELIRRTGLSRPTLYRLLHTLQRRGLIVANGEPQRFALGATVAQLAHVWSSGLDLPELARPVMQRLWEATGETVALMLHNGPVRLCVAELPSPQPLSFKRGVGHSESVIVGASGRVILAFLPDASPYLDEVPVAQRAAYLKTLETIRKDGCAVSREELIAGAVAMAAPVFLPGQRLVGSMAVFGPSVRIGEREVRRICKLLVQECARIGQVEGAPRP